MIGLLIALVVGILIGVAGTIYARPLAFSEEDVEFLRKIGTRIRTNESTPTERMFVMVASHDVFRIADRIEAFIRHSSPRKEVIQPLPQPQGLEPLELHAPERQPDSDRPR